MCGRATVTSGDGTDELGYGLRYLTSLQHFAPKYNIRPTDQIPIIRDRRPQDDDPGGRELTTLRWWLIPWWTREPSKLPLFNARAESLADKPAFRDPFRERRCLIVVDGFYEWPKKPSKDRNPRWLHYADRRLITLAGLWDRWRDERTGIRVESCTIVTTKANGLLSAVPHDRMPVILDGDARDRWLDLEESRPEMLQELLLSSEIEGLVSEVVSSEYVNHGVDDERCIQPIE